MVPPETLDGFTGVLFDVGLLDILQLLHHTRRTVVLELRGPRSGTVHLRDGELVHAVAEGLVGEEAVRAIVGFTRGNFRLLPGRPCEQTIDCSFDALLLDALRLLDEQGSVEPELREKLRSFYPGERLSTLSPPATGEQPAQSKSEGLEELWRMGCLLVGGTGLGHCALRVSLSTQECAVVQGAAWDLDASSLEHTVKLLLGLTGGSRTGHADLVSAEMAFGILWDQDRDEALLVAEPLRTPQGVVRFRSFLNTVARLMGAEEAT